mgnify:CR=1 FL=1
MFFWKKHFLQILQFATFCKKKTADPIKFYQMQKMFGFLVLFQKKIETVQKRSVLFKRFSFRSNFKIF